ncbi:MAG TPA: hypothetical protein VEX35_09375 [Allosphingosinicella sp.]|nr:hypothetical protein [Allosphingosinicella sp.]
MRLRACLGLILLGLSACESLPSAVLIDIDGSALRFKKKEPPVPPAAETAANQAADDDRTR